MSSRWIGRYASSLRLLVLSLLPPRRPTPTPGVAYLFGNMLSAFARHAATGARQAAATPRAMSVAGTPGLMSVTGMRFKSRMAAAEEAKPDTPLRPLEETETYDLPAFKTHRMDLGGLPTSTTASGAQLQEYFESMYRMRRMETKADELYMTGHVRGFCHLYNGQEAVAVGVEAAVSYEDYLITAYRNHCQQLARGDTVEAVLSELTGRVTGCSGGKGGSMHLYKPENRYFGGNGIVGAQGPLGTGLAFAAKYQGTKNVAISMFGDGAANQGQIFEALNMAQLWRLPIMFMCENNRYGMGTSTARAAASGDFYTRGDYAAGLYIDGMNVLAVREGIAYAAERCRSGEGPVYVEVDTYRYKGHSISDQGTGYRTTDEVQSMKASRDPIDQVKTMLVDGGWATLQSLKGVERSLRKEVDAAVKFATEAPQPPPEHLWKDVLSPSASGESVVRGTLVTKGGKVGTPL